MKKRNFFLIAGVSILLSCTSKGTLPENPKDKQEYKDSQGNNWIYNAMLMRWALTPTGSSHASYYYYPNNGSWTNTSGASVPAPPSVNSAVYARKASVKPNSASGNSYQKNTAKPSTGKAFKGAGSGTRSIGG